MWVGKRKLTAGGRKATEVNVGCSVAEWNPVNIVALALRKGMCITCALICGWVGVPCLVATP
jgi:hypothetical protein